MKLLRYLEDSTLRPGLCDADGNVRDLSSVIDDISGDVLKSQGISRLRQLRQDALPLVREPLTLGPCVGKSGKFICVGLNYADHARESGEAIPEEPVLFLKATSAITGPNSPIVKPRNSTKLDWEVELGVVIGEPGVYISERDARRHIAGYCVVNDVSERRFQLEIGGGQWDKGKGCDTFGPIGPWLVSSDEIADANDLPMWLEVNGVRRQSGSTRTMIFKPDFLVSYISNFMSLQSGDIISTGTPPGVGLGMKPPTFLNVGDVVTLGIEGLGSQRQEVIACE
jgi:2,4-didehydro-3-deoxy-L-rhamnonate hydrolase